MRAQVGLSYYLAEQGCLHLLPMLPRYSRSDAKAPQLTAHQLCPGYIGGRMVKWLEEITVTESESANFYHFHDNRVLPSHVTEQLAKSEGTGRRACWRCTLHP